MVLGLAKEYSLTFGLPLSIIQGSFRASFSPFHLGQLALKLLIAFLGQVEGIHGLYLSPFFLLHLTVRIIHHLLGPVRGLNSLPRRKAFNKGRKRSNKK